MESMEIKRCWETKQGFSIAEVQKFPEKLYVDLLNENLLETNSPVIIAKLKLGFIINGFEQDETMGSLLRMIYRHDPIRREAAEFRAGKLGNGSILSTYLNPSV